MTQTRRPQQPDQPRPTARTNSMTATLSVLFAMTTAGNVSAMAVADASMESTYSSLAQRAVDIYNSGKGTGLDGRCWIGIAGSPGAGKSTLASAVADIICETQSDGPKAVAIPMDGYHYTRAKLAELAQPHDQSNGISRRGAPWTFDSEALVADLAQAKLTGKASLPEYDRALSDPIPNAVELDLSHGIILVEGNYLLLDRLQAEVCTDGSNVPVLGSNLDAANKDLLCPVPIGEEIRRWRGTSALWDDTWFVSPPGDAVETLRKRLIERSLVTWSKAKTQAWGGGTDRQAATKRAEFNDVRNARLVECCRSFANLVVDSI